MKHPSFQYYSANIKASKPIGRVTLDQFLNAIKHPKPAIAEIYKRIEKAEIEQDLKLKAELKQQLYSFTPAINTGNRRRYSDISKFTGLMPLDFDHLDSKKYAEEFRDYLIEEHKFIVASWLSSSGKGVRALVRIPVLDGVDAQKSIKTYKAHFNGLAKDATFEGFEGFDYAPKNCVLPLFLSYDVNLRSREWDTTEVWRGVYYEIEIVPKKMPPRNDTVNYNLNEKRISGIVRSALSKIVDNGHLILRSISFSIGGYVGGGDVSFYFAENLIHSEIDSHFYLRQKADTYKKTATEMLNKGMINPLRLK